MDPETHQLSGLEGGDKPLHVVDAQLEISIKQQQKMLMKRIKRLNNQPKID